MRSLVPDHVRLDRLRNQLLSDLSNYQKDPVVYGAILREDFYHNINCVGSIRTGVFTKDALKLGRSKVTQDHINAPRRMCDVLLTYPDLLFDVDKYYEVVQYARYTIGVTVEQNIMVKQRADGSIHDLSVHVYSNIPTLWYEDTKGYTKQFPTQLIYPKLTEYEHTLLTL